VTSYGPTRRQQQVLDLLMRGHERAEIARALGIAWTTADNHLDALRTRFGARHTLDLVCTLWARRLAETEKELAEANLALDKCRRDLAGVDRRGRVGSTQQREGSA